MPVSGLDSAASPELLAHLPQPQIPRGIGSMVFVESNVEPVSGGFDKESLPPRSSSDRDQRPFDEIAKPGVRVFSLILRLRRR